ncbi:unnamed protein product [Brassica oleracea var. botrytis]
MMILQRTFVEQESHKFSFEHSLYRMKKKSTKEYILKRSPIPPITRTIISDNVTLLHFPPKLVVDCTNSTTTARAAHLRLW